MRPGLAAAAPSPSRPLFPPLGHRRHFARLRQPVAVRRRGGPRCLREMAPARRVGFSRGSSWRGQHKSCEGRRRRGADRLPAPRWRGLPPRRAGAPSPAATCLPARPPARASLSSTGFRSSLSTHNRRPSVVKLSVRHLASCGLPAASRSEEEGEQNPSVRRGAVARQAGAGPSLADESVTQAASVSSRFFPSLSELAWKCQRLFFSSLF